MSGSNHPYDKRQPTFSKMSYVLLSVVGAFAMLTWLYLVAIYPSNVGHAGAAGWTLAVLVILLGLLLLVMGITGYRRDYGRQHAHAPRRRVR